MKSKTIIFCGILLFINGCFYNSYYFERSSQIYNDSDGEIKILYSFTGKEYLRVYYIPKNIDSCNEYLSGVKAKLIIKINDTMKHFNFSSKSGTSIYDLSTDGAKFILRDKNDTFGAYYSMECCGCKSWFSHCMANLYYLDSMNIHNLNINRNDNIWYEISGKIYAKGKLIDINKSGILEEGNVYGRPKPKGFKSR